MTWEQIKTILTIIFSGLGVFFTGYWAYRAAKPKSVADGEKVKAEVLVTFADGWRGLYHEEKERNDKLDKKIDELTKSHQELDRKFEKMKVEKEEKAKESLKKDEKIRELEDRIKSLENELEKYKSMASQIKDAAHTIVEEVAAKVTNNEPLT